MNALVVAEPNPAEPATGSPLLDRLWQAGRGLLDRLVKKRSQHTEGDMIRAMKPEQISGIAMHAEVWRIDAGNRHRYARVDVTDALNEHPLRWGS